MKYRFESRKKTINADRTYITATSCSPGIINIMSRPLIKVNRFTDMNAPNNLGNDKTFGYFGMSS